MIKFNNNISVILPTEDNEKNPINYDGILKPIGEAYGGYTMFSCVSGVWYDNGTRYEDKSQILRIDFLELNKEQIKTLMDLIDFLFITQYAIMLMIDGRSLFIDQENKKQLKELLKNI